VADSFIAELRAGTPLPAIGTAHGHVQLPNGLLARVAYAHEGDPAAAARLRIQAAAFGHLAASGRTPKLHQVVEPQEGLPGGALIIDFIDGRAPRLPAELDAMADTLARIHSLPLPGAPIPRQTNPFIETLEAVEANAARYLDKAIPDSGARAEIAEELRLMRGMALAFARRAQPLTVALADTHPGNFIVDRAGIAWFVDLEKVHVGSPAIDLAHATLPTSTLWDPKVGVVLSRTEVESFHEAYFARIDGKSAEALRPWLTPMRRLTWLRTTLFMARWRAQTRAPRDPSDPTQWSDAGLDHKMKGHIDAVIDRCFGRDFILGVRSSWAS